MKVTTEIRKSTPVMAVVGVTDLATHALRTAQAELTPAKLQANAQNLPNLAISKALEAAGKAEQTYSGLATRGKSLVDSVRRGSATKDLLAQSRSTLTLGKAAVTTVRKASDDTLVAAKATLTSGRREAAELVGSLVGEVTTEAKQQAQHDVAEVKAAKPAAKKATKSTRSAAKRTATTARTRTATAKKATKATRTSARKTAAKATTATKKAAARTGR